MKIFAPYLPESEEECAAWEKDDEKDEDNDGGVHPAPDTHIILPEHMYTNHEVKVYHKKKFNIIIVSHSALHTQKA